MTYKVLMLIVVFKLVTSITMAQAFDALKNQSKMPRLIKAIWEHNETEALQLIMAGENVNATDNEGGLFPVLAAVETNNIKILQALAAKGADLSHVTRDGCLPIHYTEDSEMINFLRENSKIYWECKRTNDEYGEKYLNPQGCLAGDKSQPKLARKLNDHAIKLYNEKGYEFALGYLKAAAHLDCSYLLARINLAGVLSVRSERNHVDFAIPVLLEAYKLDSELTLKKIKTDKDFNNLKASLSFRESQVGRAYIQKFGEADITSAFHAKLPIKMGDDEITIRYSPAKKGGDRNRYFLVSKKNGEKFVFDSCRVHFYHHCGGYSNEVIFDPKLNRLTLSIDCIPAGENRGDKVTERVSIDLNKRKVIDDEYSKADPLADCPK